MALSVQALTATMVHEAATGGTQLDAEYKGLPVVSRRFCEMHRSFRECPCCGPAKPGRSGGLEVAGRALGTAISETSFLQDMAAPTTPETVKNAEAVAAELGFVDTHCHLEEVLQQVKRYQSAPSLSKSFEALDAEEEAHFRTLGWLWISTERSSSSGAAAGAPDAAQSSPSASATESSSSNKGSQTWARRWEVLRPQEREAAVTLGWTPATWDVNRWHLPRNQPWAALDREMRRCLLVLGETEDSWDTWRTRNTTEHSVLGSRNSSAKENREWIDLLPIEQAAARALGLTEGTWDTTEMADLASCKHLFGIGFRACVAQGCDTVSVHYAEELALAHPEVYASFGCHPKGASTYTDEFEGQLLAAMKRCGRKAVAWGEFGLDYSHLWFGKQGHFRRLQKEVFAKQLKLAIKNGFALVLHSRAADRDTLRMMRQFVPRDWKVHMHSYRGCVSFLEDMVTDWTHCYIGFSGLVTMGDTQVEELCKRCPVEKMLLETDAPYLPLNGTNYSHPGHIPAIAARIAELKGCPVRDVLTATRENAKVMYGI